jgi:hypothetical protein
MFQGDQRFRRGTMCAIALLVLDQAKKSRPLPQRSGFSEFREDVEAIPAGRSSRRVMSIVAASDYGLANDRSRSLYSGGQSEWPIESG